MVLVYHRITMITMYLYSTVSALWIWDRTLLQQPQNFICRWDFLSLVFTTYQAMAGGPGLRNIQVAQDNNTC